MADEGKGMEARREGEEKEREREQEQEQGTRTRTRMRNIMRKGSWDRRWEGEREKGGRKGDGNWDGNKSMGNRIVVK
jgi:hypothetical protein